MGLVREGGKGLGEALPGHLELELDALEGGGHGGAAQRDLEDRDGQAARDPVAPVVQAERGAHEGYAVVWNQAKVSLW